MIYWIYGESGSGKTTLANKLKTPNTLILDGDSMRESISNDLGFSKGDRIKNNLRVARLAKILEAQGFDVVVATICPGSKLREEIYWITKCRFIHIRKN